MAMVMVGQEEGVMGFPAHEARHDFDHAPFCVKKRQDMPLFRHFPTHHANFNSRFCSYY